MTASSIGDVVVVPFPFTDLRTTKRRPALVLARLASATVPSLVIVAMVTSQLQSGHLPGDCRLSKWTECGLLHPSKARLGKLVSLEERMLGKKLGSLTSDDVEKVRRELRKLFAFWI